MDSHSGSDFSHSDFASHSHHDASSFGADHSHHAHHDTSSSSDHSHHSHHTHHTHHTHPANDSHACNSHAHDPRDHSPASDADTSAPFSTDFTAWNSAADDAPPSITRTSHRNSRGPQSRVERALAGIFGIVFGFIFCGVALSTSTPRHTPFTSMGPPALLTYAFVAVGVLVAISGLVQLARAVAPSPPEFTRLDDRPPRPAAPEAPQRQVPVPPAPAPRTRLAACPGCGARPTSTEITCRYCHGSLLKN